MDTVKLEREFLAVGWEPDCDDVCHPPMGCCHGRKTGPMNWRETIAAAREYVARSGRRCHVWSYTVKGTGERAWSFGPYTPGSNRETTQEGCTHCGFVGPYMVKCEDLYHKQFRIKQGRRETNGKASSHSG